MPLAPDTDNYMKAGKGKVYFEPTGETGHLHLGNIPKLELTPEIEKDEHFSSMESTLEADESWVIKKSLKGSVDLEEASPDNINLAFMGDGVVEGSQSAGYLDAVSTTTVDDRFVDLEYTDLSILKLSIGSVVGGPFVFGETVTGGTSGATADIAWVGSGFLEVVNLSGTFVVGETITGGTSAATAPVTVVESLSDVVVTDHATVPTTRYTAGTDYDVDVIGGMIRELSGGSIAAHTGFVSADYEAKTHKSVRVMAGDEAEGELLFIGTGDNGPRYRITAWKAKLTMSGAFGVISESDVATMSMDVEILSDRANHPSEPFFRATEIS